MDNKKIGVIISCYNHADYVEQAIDSILNQTYKDVDVYAADDASTDGTGEKLVQYDEDLLEIHLFDENQGGLGKFLLDRVDNEYTALLNSDDFWHEDKLEKQINYMESNPDCAACFTWCRQVNEQGEGVKGIDAFRQTNRSSEEWMRYFYENGNCLAHPSILIRTDIYKELVDNCYDAFRQLPDYQIWVKLIQYEKIHIIEEELVSFRWHSTQNSTNVSAPSHENLARHYNEESYMWYETITAMEDDFFINAFRETLISNNANIPEEIMCEKFFLLARARNELTRQTAIYYFYDIFKNKVVQDCFLEKYSFGKKDFYKLELEIGCAKQHLDKIKNMEVMHKIGQVIIDANR